MPSSAPSSSARHARVSSSGSPRAGRELLALRGVAGAALWPELGRRRRGELQLWSLPNLVARRAVGLLELDVFGGLRRAVEAADADVGAAIEDRRALLLALVGSVATTYVELRGLESLITTVRRNLAAQEETRSLTEAQRRAGLASDLDVERARAQMSGRRPDPPSERPHGCADRLSVRLRAPAPSAPRRRNAPIPRRPGAGSSVWADLSGASGSRRAARSSLRLPRHRLGEANSVRASPGRLWPAQRLDAGSSPARTFASIGRDRWPVFARDASANVAATDARQEQALARYELALLTALEEAENSLDRHAREQLRRLDLRDAVAANREAVELARRLYANGLGGFLDVLVAERFLLETESRLVESETAVSTSLVSVYVALGGGWQQAEALRLR